MRVASKKNVANVRKLWTNMIKTNFHSLKAETNNNPIKTLSQKIIFAFAHYAFVFSISDVLMLKRRT